MIKNLTKLGCHLVCWTYYLKIAHYLPHLIFWELTSLCGNQSNDQRTHLFGIFSRVGVRSAGVSLLPFLFVINHHLAAASGEAGLEVTSAISEMVVTSATLTMAPEGGVDLSLSLSLDFAPHRQSVTKPNLSFSLHLGPLLMLLAAAVPGRHIRPESTRLRSHVPSASPSGQRGTSGAQP